MPYGNISIASLNSLKLRSNTKSVVLSHSIDDGFPIQLVAQNGKHSPISVQKKSPSFGHLHIPMLQSLILGLTHSSTAQLSQVSKLIQFIHSGIPHIMHESFEEQPNSHSSLQS